MIQSPKNQKGFTLVELVAATAITGILIIVIMSFLINSLVQISVDTARADLLRNAQISLDTITRDLRASSNAYDTSSIPDDHAPGETENWESTTDTLVIATAALDSDKNILFADELHYTSFKNNNVYFVENGTLYKRTLAANVPENAATTTCPIDQANEDCPSDIVLTRDVKQFTLHYYDGNGDEVAPSAARSVGVTLELAATKYGRDITAEYTTRTVFRNQ